MVAAAPSQSVTQTVDLTLVPLPAIQRAAYSLSDEFDVSIERVSQTSVAFTVSAKDANGNPPSVGDLNRLLLDFALRVDIEERTRSVKESLVSVALRHAK